MTLLSYLQSQLSLPEKSILKTIELLNEDCTIPFIARYRKEATGGLDELAIQSVLDAHSNWVSLQQRKSTILAEIEKQQLNST